MEASKNSKPNPMSRPADWNKKPEAGYLDTNLKDKPEKRPLMPTPDVPKGTGAISKQSSFKISPQAPRPASGRVLSNQEGQKSPPKTEKKVTIEEKERPGTQNSANRFTTHLMRPLTANSLLPRSSLNYSQSGSGLDFTIQNIPSLSIKEYYRDSKLFEVIQKGVFEIGKNR